MRERDLQDYIFENPNILFPDQVIDRKRREVFIEGRRIDLLFEVENVQYIIELKRDTIRREDIGQVFEYYGLMRQSKETAKFKMILVAPSIPSYRRIPLEEFGIRCFELSYPVKSAQENAALVKDSIARRTLTRGDAGLFSEDLDIAHLRFEDFLPPPDKKAEQLAHQMLRDGLPIVQKSFAEYEILPVKMSHSQDILCLPTAGSSSQFRFVEAGVWWAFRFGHSEEDPKKNDVPNISVNALPWGLDFAVNAELRPSQEVMRDRISRFPIDFDRLVREHGDLLFQAWLKLEHQPRIYHWIPIAQQERGSWQSRNILDKFRVTEQNYEDLRSRSIRSIKEQRPDISVGQISHMERRNQKLNLAVRLVCSLQKENSVWNLSYLEQKVRFGDEYRRLKPLIDFFQ